MRNKLLIYFITIITTVISLKILAIEPTDSGYITVGDGDLYYEQFGKKDAKPIIVLHGGPGLDSSYLLPQMAKFVDQKYLMTFYDQRGSGKSTNFVIDRDTINMQNFVQDLDKVRNAIGADKVVIVGHSWGTLLGINYAVANPNKIAALILISGAPSSTEEFKVFIAEYQRRIKNIQPELNQIENSQAYLAGDPIAVTDYFSKIFSVYFYDPAKIPELTLKFTKQSALDGRLVAKIFEETYISNFNLSKDLQQLTIPVLIIHGENDIVPLSTAETTHKLIKGSQMAIIKECDHFPYIEKQDELFYIMQRFIAQE
jgi:proline iminopeptidase